MEGGRKYNKSLTTVTGDGLTNTSTNNSKMVEPREVVVQGANNHRYNGEDDSHPLLSGAGGGDYSSEKEANPFKWGGVSPSGSRIEINDESGTERIQIVHHSGAAVTIDPDGAVYIVSESARGAGIGAAKGDFYVSAGGDVVVRGASSVTVDTPGDMTINVGGTLTINAGAYALITRTMDETVDGSAVRHVTNDQQVVIGGIKRDTIAGDSREQVTGNKIVDVSGTSTTRVDGNTTLDVGGTLTNTSKGNQTCSTSADMRTVSSGKSRHEAGGKMEVTSGGGTTVSGPYVHNTASGEVILKGGSVHSNPPIDRAFHTRQSENTLLAIAPGGSMLPTPDLKSADQINPDAAGTAKEAQTVAANDIVDELTSARKYPKYPMNGVLEAANATGYGTIEYDKTDQAQEVFDEYSGKNVGNANPSQSGGSYDTLDESPVNRPNNIESVQPDGDPPARADGSQKLSKYFTLGQFTGAKYSHPIPQSVWKKVVKNHMLLAVNVLDSIKEKFPDIIITSAYRANSPNHVTGKAIDIVTSSRSLTVHAEIARYARDNLPVDQVFLERNTSGRTHVHLRVSEAGQKSTPRVMTCGDPQCNSKTPGIDVEWLGRKAK